MAFAHDTLIRLTTRLNQAKGLSLNDSGVALNNYQDIFNAVKDQELAHEIRLLELIINAKKGDASALFKQ